ncbi:myosin-11-like [Physella acuta]|uniref:myosin-11-like n=1 Tax=Physella acuta TaxID=109671 RepID=UPI0027DC5DB7|nr:myosin-11-like [Physella acuta]
MVVPPLPLGSPSTVPRAYIKAENNSKGEIQASLLLCSRLLLYKGWYKCLIQTLKDPGVKLSHVAQLIENKVKELSGSLQTGQAMEPEKTLIILKLQDEKSGLQQNVTVMEKGMLELKEENGNLQKEIVHLKEIIAQLRRHIAWLEGKYQACEDSKKHLKILARFKLDPDVVKLMEEICELKKKLDTAVSLTLTIENLKYELSQRNRDRVKIAEKNKSLNEKILDINRTFSGNYELLQEELMQLKAKLLILEKQNASMKEENRKLKQTVQLKDTSNNVNLIDEINRLKQTISRLESEKFKLSELIQNKSDEITKKTSEITRQLEEILHLRKELDHQTNIAEERLKENTKLTSHEKQLNHLFHRNLFLSDELKRYKDRAELLDKEKSFLIDELQKYKEKAESLETQKCNLQIEIDIQLTELKNMDILKEQNNQLRRQLEELQNKYDNLETLYKKLQDELESSNKHNERITNEKTLLQIEHDIQSQEIKQLEGKQADHENLMQKFLQLQKKYADLENENRNLLIENRNQKWKIDRLEKEKREANAITEKKPETTTVLSKNLQDLMDAISQHNKPVVQQSQTIFSFKTEPVLTQPERQKTNPIYEPKSIRTNPIYEPKSIRTNPIYETKSQPQDKSNDAESDGKEANNKFEPKTEPDETNVKNEPRNVSTEGLAKPKTEHVNKPNPENTNLMASLVEKPKEKIKNNFLIFSENVANLNQVVRSVLKKVDLVEPSVEEPIAVNRIESKDQIFSTVTCFLSSIQRSGFQKFWMYKNILRCIEAVDYTLSAIILPICFDQPISKLDLSFIEILKGVLGDDIVKTNVICLVLKPASKDMNATFNFEEWCKIQKDDIGMIFKECRYRCVLLEYSGQNQVTNRKQFSKLFNWSTQMLKYTRERYDRGLDNRKRFIAENKLEIKLNRS